MIWPSVVLHLFLPFVASASQNCYEVQQLFNEIVGRKPRVKYTDLYQNVGSPYNFQLDIWVRLLSSLDPWALWLFSQTNKWFSSLIRDDRIGLKFMWKNEIVLRIIMMNSELPIPDYAWPIIQPDVDAVLPKRSEEQLKRLSRDELVMRLHIAAVLLTRSTGLFIPQYVVKRSGVYLFDRFLSMLDTRLIVVEPGTEVYREPCFHYLSPKTDTKLFDKVNPAVIAASMTSGLSGQEQAFVLSIFADYILPRFHGVYNYIGHDQKILFDLYPSICNGSYGIMRHLLWTIYLSEGCFDSMASTNLWNFFRRMSWTWRELIVNQPNKKSFDVMFRKRTVPDMMGVFMFAKWWGYDITKIAEKTKEWCHVSVSILEGRIPSILQSKELPSAKDFFDVIYGPNPMPIEAYYQRINSGYTFAAERPARMKIALSQRTGSPVISPEFNIKSKNPTPPVESANKARKRESNVYNPSNAKRRKINEPTGATVPVEEPNVLTPQTTFSGFGSEDLEWALSGGECILPQIDDDFNDLLCSGFD